MAEKTYRAVGDAIEGDIISIECRKYSKWQVFRMSGQHKGSRCLIEKNAKAKIKRAYTNIKSAGNAAGSP
jgi:hypothetical protein